MATIKMDVTEYQEMQKVAELLKESAAREEEFRKTIQLMQAEKIDILEQNKHIVTIKKEVHTFETAGILVSGTEFKRNILFLADELRSNNNEAWKIGSDDLTYARDSYNNMFRQHKHHTTPEVTTVYKGFDEIIDEMKVDYYNGQNEDIRKRLVRADGVRKENNVLTDENKKLMKSLEMSNSMLKQSQKDLKYFRETAKNFVKYIEKAIYMPINMFNYSEFKIRLIKILKSYEQN